MSSWANEFRDFINRGNVIDLAIAVVLGTAFAIVVNSFVDDIVMQLIAAIVGEPDFRQLTFGLGDSEIRYGSFLTELVSFVLIALAVFFMVKAYNRFRRDAGEDPATPTEVELLTEIRDALVQR